jgi:hypothetical protein
MPTPPGGPLSPELLDAAVELMGRSGRGATLRVTGRSMEPTLLDGQTVALELAPRALARGDLLVFRQAGYLVVHRCLGARRGPGGARELRTRGDGVPGLDPAVTLDRVLGRVVAVEGRAGWLSVRGRAARVYATAVAWHDRLWALAIHAGHRGDALLARIGLAPRIAALAAACDHALLCTAHRMLHARVHRPAPAPGAAGDAPGSAATML